MAIWYILWSFGTLSPILVCCAKKNRATLETIRMWHVLSGALPKTIISISCVCFYWNQVLENAQRANSQFSDKHLSITYLCVCGQNCRIMNAIKKQKNKLRYYCKFDVWEPKLIRKIDPQQGSMPRDSSNKRSTGSRNGYVSDGEGYILQQQNRRVTRSGKYGGSHSSSPGGPGGSGAGTKSKTNYLRNFFYKNYPTFCILNL
jgi:uncharacterized membrane protein YgcG